MKNIAIVVWELNIKGGTQRQALNLASELQKKGNKVDVFCYYYDISLCYTDLCSKLNIKYISSNNEKRKKSNNKVVERILRPINAYSDLIKNILFVEKQIKKLSQLIKGQKTEYEVINLHDYEVYKLARALKHQNILWTLNDIRRPKNNSKYFLHRTFYNLLLKILIYLEIKNIKKIFVLDNKNKKLCKENYNRDVTIIRSGIDLNLPQEIFDKSEKHNDNKIKIFASSIFFPYRRFEDLVEATKILIQKGYENITVSINGVNSRHYDYYLFIKNLISEYHLEDFIKITNGLSEEMLYKKYYDSDIFVFPNHNQTWGLAVFEAMLFENACIVSKTSGAHEVLSDKKNALLVNPKSPKEIAEAIETLIIDPKYMSEIAKNAKKFVIDNMSWRKYAEEMEKQF